jgi:sterol desaturase/sphingolipid hydroxylase (fatty acid hydroxylase superfamily)
MEFGAADWIAIGILLIYAAIAIVEWLRPARQFPRIPRWNSLGVMLFFYLAILNGVVVSLLPTDWLASHSLLDLSRLGTLPGILVGHLLTALAMYGWHRTTHAVDFLWRGFHQLHHSPRHLNIFVAGVNHPLDLAIYISLPFLIGLFVLGLTPFAAAMLSNIAGFNAFLQHSNIATPRWIALLFQRPEAHCIHHQRGLHAYNYSDLPLWDVVFGTFRNPERWDGETGFDPPADTRFGAMLAFVDVNKPELGVGSLGQKTERGKYFNPG